MAEFAIFIIIMIVLSVVGKLKQQSAKSSGTPNPRVQKVIERIQAQVQQNGGPPLDRGPKYTKYSPPTGSQRGSGTAPSSQQVAATLQQVLQAGRQPYQNQPAPQPYQPQYQPPAHRPPQNNLPAPNQDLDARVRQLMTTGNEVGAIRLLCDERDLGILESQKYARALVTPAGTKSTPGSASDAEPEPDEDDTRYVGSAAFAESIFDLDRDEEVWASGWVDTPEPEDRTDIDELWQTVRNASRPGVTPPS